MFGRPIVHGCVVPSSFYFYLYAFLFVSSAAQLIVRSRKPFNVPLELSLVYSSIALIKSTFFNCLPSVQLKIAARVRFWGVGSRPPSWSGRKNQEKVGLVTDHLWDTIRVRVKIIHVDFQSGTISSCWFAIAICSKKNGELDTEKLTMPMFEDLSCVVFIERAHMSLYVTLYSFADPLIFFRLYQTVSGVNGLYSTTRNFRPLGRSWKQIKVFFQSIFSKCLHVTLTLTMFYEYRFRRRISN